jgi:hypothetical protein
MKKKLRWKISCCCPFNGTVVPDFRPTVLSIRSTHLDPDSYHKIFSYFASHSWSHLNSKFDSLPHDAVGSLKNCKLREFSYVILIALDNEVPPYVIFDIIVPLRAWDVF